MRTFFCSDFHFGHKLMCRTRNFSSIAEHDATLIKNFNSQVTPQDIVYFLGDFSFSSYTDYLFSLNGKFHFIEGNHDKGLKEQVCGLSTKVLSYTKGYSNIFINKQPITLCHFPMVSWEKSHYGAWQLFGHHHSKFCPSAGKSMNVSMDALNMLPVSFEDVQLYMNTRSDNWDLVKDKEKRL